MLLILTRRVGIFIATFVAASIVTFLLLSSLPGNAARVALGVNATAADVQAQEKLMGLDRPLPIRYFDWFGHLIIGDFGRSTISGQLIGPQVGSAVQVTGILLVSSVVIALLIAVPVGIFTAVRQNRLDGTLVSGLSQLGVSVPGFLAGMLLIALFSVALKWLPATGWVAPAQDPIGFLEHLILPAVSLGIVQGAVLARYVRSSVLDIVREDFLRTARAKGFSQREALVRHGLRNAAIPVTTVLGLQVAALLIGTVVIERVFAIPGLGTLLLQQVALRDLPTVQSLVMVLVGIVLVLNLLVDITHTLIDPRLRSS